MMEVLSKANLFSSCHHSQQDGFSVVFPKSRNYKSSSSVRWFQPLKLKSQALRSSSDFYGKRIVLQENKALPKRGNFRFQSSIKAQVGISQIPISLYTFFSFPWYHVSAWIFFFFFLGFVNSISNRKFMPCNWYLTLCIYYYLLKIWMLRDFLNAHDWFFCREINGFLFLCFNFFCMGYTDRLSDWENSEMVGKGSSTKHERGDLCTRTCGLPIERRG